jgi:hypothetical protein
MTSLPSRPRAPADPHRPRCRQKLRPLRHHRAPTTRSLHDRRQPFLAVRQPRGEHLRLPGKTLGFCHPFPFPARTTSVGRRSSLDRTAELALYRFGTPEPLTNLAHGQVRIPPTAPPLRWIWAGPARRRPTRSDPARSLFFLGNQFPIFILSASL